MRAQGFKWSVFDPCLYIKRMSNKVFDFIILVLYMDDMLIATKDRFWYGKTQSFVKFWV